MARCDVCSNDYGDAFQVTKRGRTMTFDSFEDLLLRPLCA